MAEPRDAELRGNVTRSFLQRLDAVAPADGMGRIGGLMTHLDPCARANAPELDPQAIYLSPSGRCCRVCQSDSTRPTETFATFIYDRKDGNPNTGVFAEGFTLSRANWHLMRRLA